MSDQAPNKFSVFNLPDLPDSIDNAVKNLTDKPTKNFGTTFADCWFLVFGEISHKANKKRMKYAWELEKYQNELSKAIDSIPTDKLVEPSIQVTAQALENSKYCISSANLRKMFVNLISGTMHADLEPHVHPSFPEILKQLSENDALMLQILKRKPQLPIANIGIYLDAQAYQILSHNICPYPLDATSDITSSVSISSLERSGLVLTSYTEHINDENAYNLIKTRSIYKAIEDSSKSMSKKIYFRKGLCRLTPLGAEFIHSCVS